ncbi:YELLOW STRIPE like 2 [Perilla frutescens var. hirtella]|uniref:YELLOW STRIPE like 2 n=1 Tax=Perilla frutescens var. hirtella TaxID=608512 RepID=A0AAD4J806_PERFH|nr:YELLOW STRIPE like 2 [Perilla frutescens var. hirtella]
MRIFGKNIYPRQIVVLASGILVLVTTSYDVHRSIQNNHTPPSREQLQALEDYINSSRRPPP